MVYISMLMAEESWFTKAFTSGMANTKSRVKVADWQKLVLVVIRRETSITGKMKELH